MLCATIAAATVSALGLAFGPLAVVSPKSILIVMCKLHLGEFQKQFGPIQGAEEISAETAYTNAYDVHRARQGSRVLAFRHHAAYPVTACDINLRHHTLYRVTAYDVHRARQGLQVQALGVNYLDDSSLTLKRPWMSDGPDPRRKVRDDLDADCIQCQMSEDQCFTTCDDQVNGYGHYEMDLQLVCLGASLQPIIDFFNTYRTLYDKERESLITEGTVQTQQTIHKLLITTFVNTNSGQWTRAEQEAPSSVHLVESVKEELVADFLDTCRTLYVKERESLFTTFANTNTARAAWDSTTCATTNELATTESARNSDNDALEKFKNGEYKVLTMKVNSEQAAGGNLVIANHIIFLTPARGEDENTGVSETHPDGDGSLRHRSVGAAPWNHPHRQDSTEGMQRGISAFARVVPRLVPTVKWYIMCLKRQQAVVWWWRSGSGPLSVADNILPHLARRGLRTPPGTNTALLKLWKLIATPTNERRRFLIRGDARSSANINCQCYMLQAKAALKAGKSLLP
ncbi:uncharacterized protein PG998_013193 [Apiospora kogelbergensis]|uniref:uncharacterized protein n=1 Tax=Apiospora kogelbergensis TaxID=1337665 RepID=UPI0031323AF9